MKFGVRSQILVACLAAGLGVGAALANEDPPEVTPGGNCRGYCSAQTLPSCPELLRCCCKNKSGAWTCKCIQQSDPEYNACAANDNNPNC